MADTINFTWLYDLYEYGLTTDKGNDYVAKVHANSSLTVEDIAASIAADRTDIRPDTITMVLKLFKEKTMEQVCMGNIVNTGFDIIQPTITGVFSGKGAAFGDSNKLKISIAPSQEFRNMLTDVSVEFTGNYNEAGGAYTTSVINENTKEEAGTITPGGMITISGNKIKCLNEDGSGFGQINLVNVESGTSTAITVFAQNTPKSITCLVPTDLAAGQYSLQIVTYFSGNSKYLKSARTIEHSQYLTVE